MIAAALGAVRFETIGVIAGRDAIVIEHVNRMALDLAPTWPSAARDGTYRIVVEGEPGLQCELTVGTPESFSAQGMLATTMRIVNAIPAVCAAPPGLLELARPAAHPAPTCDRLEEHLMTDRTPRQLGDLSRAELARLGRKFIDRGRSSRSQLVCLSESGAPMLNNLTS
jgi:hypothetical protein